MNTETIAYEKEKIIRVLRDLNVLVVSIDRIGSAWHDRVSDEQYNAMFLQFFDEFEFYKKLAAARRVLSDAFPDAAGEDGMDELERRCQDLKYWPTPQE